MHLNIEFKARVPDTGSLEKKLLQLNPRSIGEDHQVDTYFSVSNGRLKLREGNLENALNWSDRPDLAGSKRWNVVLYPHPPAASLKEALIRANGVKVVVAKRRRIYFIGNVKFHFDQVDGLGTFIEVEAIDADGTIGAQRLQEQCDEYAAFFGITPADHVARSYSDLLLEGI